MIQNQLANASQKGQSGVLLMYIWVQYPTVNCVSESRWIFQGRGVKQHTAASIQSTTV